MHSLTLISQVLPKRTRIGYCIKGAICWLHKPKEKSCLARSFFRQKTAKQFSKTVTTTVFDKGGVLSVRDSLEHTLRVFAGVTKATTTTSVDDQ